MQHRSQFVSIPILIFYTILPFVITLDTIFTPLSHVAFVLDVGYILPSELRKSKELHLKPNHHQGFAPVSPVILCRMCSSKWRLAPSHLPTAPRRLKSTRTTPSSCSHKNRAWTASARAEHEISVRRLCRCLLLGRRGQGAG